MDISGGLNFTPRSASSKGLIRVSGVAAEGLDLNGFRLIDNARSAIVYKLVRINSN